MSDSTLGTPQAGLLIKFYPVALIVIGVLMNLLVFGVQPTLPALPTPETISVLTFSAILLSANHTWLMTTTELTRMRFELATTPEE